MKIILSFQIKLKKENQVKKKLEKNQKNIENHFELSNKIKKNKTKLKKIRKKPKKYRKSF